MSLPLEQHWLEIERNRRSWNEKPILRGIYSQFYARIVAWIRRGLSGQIVEIGSGIGNLKEHVPEALATDLFPNPWLDLICDGYEIPFQDQSISNLILFDVFHHLEKPGAFLKEADRVVKRHGRVIIFEPYISLSSAIAYGCFHHEPVGWRKAIDLTEGLPHRPRSYYAAQGNATRLFFRNESSLPLHALKVEHAEAFASFRYLLSGGFSRRCLYPDLAVDCLKTVDEQLSRWPRLFASRCLVVLSK